MKWKRESKAEASEDARKRAWFIKVRTDDYENPQTSQIAAGSASKCYIAASLVAEHMWVFVIFGRERSTKPTQAPKMERIVSAGAVGGAQEEGDVRRETNLQEGLEPEKVSCLMMREAARGHLRAVREGQ